MQASIMLSSGQGPVPGWPAVELILYSSSVIIVLLERKDQRLEKLLQMQCPEGT